MSVFLYMASSKRTKVAWWCSG